MKNPTVPVNEMSLFFAAYGNRGLHYLLPLEDWATLLLVTGYILAAGAATAHGAFWARRGEVSGFAVMTLVFILGSGLIANDRTAVAICAVMALALCAGSCIGLVDRAQDERESNGAQDGGADGAQI